VLSIFAEDKENLSAENRNKCGMEAGLGFEAGKRFMGRTGKNGKLGCASKWKGR
jgi:hypothetical protein